MKKCGSAELHTFNAAADTDAPNRRKREISFGRNPTLICYASPNSQRRRFIVTALPKLNLFHINITN